MEDRNSQTFRPAKVLIVDDHPAVREAYVSPSDNTQILRFAAKPMTCEMRLH